MKYLKWIGANVVSIKVLSISFNTSAIAPTATPCIAARRTIFQVAIAHTSGNLANRTGCGAVTSAAYGLLGSSVGHIILL